MFDQAEDLDRYEWQVFHGGIADPSTLPDGVQRWWGDHSNACGPPATAMPPRPDQLREVHTHAANPEPGPTAQVGEMAWWCAPGNDPDKGHFMTALETVGYGSVAFSPPETFRNVRRICWDQSLNDVAGWWLQLDVIPAARFDANGGDLHYASPAQQSEVARNAIRLTGDDFMFEMLRGSTHTYVGQTVDDPNFSNVLGIVPPHDRATRYRHCVEDRGNGTIRVELYDRRGPGDLEVRSHRGAIPDGDVRVIFEHSSYHNSKDAAHYDTFNGLGDELTVHWDNVTIEGG